VPSNPPLFPPHLWNVHEATLDNTYRTNNNLEGWNSRFNSLVNIRHPGCFEIIEKIQQDYALQHAELSRWENMGELPTQRQYFKYASLQKRLWTLCKSYVDGHMSRADFLRRVARNISLGDKVEEKENEEMPQEEDEEN
jgi:predicted restriction endonuclease